MMCINRFMNSDDCISHFHTWNTRKTTIDTPNVRLNRHFRYLNTFNVFIKIILFLSTVYSTGILHCYLQFLNVQLQLRTCIFRDAMQ